MWKIILTYLVLVIVLILKLVLYYLISSLIVTVRFSRAKVRGYNAVLYQEQKVPLRGTIIFSFCGPKVPTYTTFSFFVPVDLGQEKVAEELFVFGTEGFKVAVVVFACWWFCVRRRIRVHVSAIEILLAFWYSKTELSCYRIVVDIFHIVAMCTSCT